MIDPNSRTRSREYLLIGVLLLAATLVFWKVRILDLGTNPTIELGPIDLYIEHTPMAEYAYDELSKARLPLWNPYQLAGQPFFAVPHVAVLYPLHLFSLAVDAETAIEISFVLHMLLGGFGMAWLARRLDLSNLAAACAALTFMWSGWTIFMNVVPGIFAGLNWLPLTLVLLDRAVARERASIPCLLAAVTAQVLLGASEVLLHTLYVGAAFTGCRLLQTAWAGDSRKALARGAIILAAMLSAPLLAAPQLLPSLEMVAASGRSGDSLDLAAATLGAIPATRFLHEAIGATGWVTVGVMPLLALPLVLGATRHRFAWGFGSTIALVGSLLVFGGIFYEAYYSIPILGSLFRRPVKFLDLYAFGQALVAGVAVAQLQAMAHCSREELWKHARWLACLGVAIAACGWTAYSTGRPNMAWLAVALLLVVFGLLRSPGGRGVVLVALVGVQAASLFFEVGGTHLRPIERPEIFHRRDSLLQTLEARSGHQRVHLSAAFLADPSLTPKQGVLRHLRVSTDYEPLAARRYQRFFDEVAPGDQQKRLNPFAGFYSLGPKSNWGLMDLTSTRYYVMAPGEPAAKAMRRHGDAFIPAAREQGLQVFERPSALPRAHLVSNAVVQPDGDAALAALLEPGFDPRSQVVLETPERQDSRGADSSTTQGKVEFVLDDPEEIVLRVETSTRAYLVLNDMHDPGWRATVDDRTVEIMRANYLFRAIELEPGTSRVRFTYEPPSLRVGTWIAGATLAAWLLGGWVASGGLRRWPISR